MDKGFLNSSFGVEYNSISGHANYKGFGLNWGKVLLHHGPGCYRVKAQTIWAVNEEIQTSPQFTATLPVDMTIGTLGIVMDNGKKVTVHIGDTIPVSVLKDVLKRNIDLKQQGVSDIVASRAGSTVKIEAKGRIQNEIQRITIVGIPAGHTHGPSVPPADEDDDTFAYATTDPPTERTVFYSHCLTSRTFDLKAWHCDLADGTAKFETWTDGQIGDKMEPYVMHSICGMNWFDSVRLHGWFGDQKVPEYRRTQLEWGQPFHGKIESVSSEAIHGYNFHSMPLPHWLHERLAVYMMMSDEVRASDYNAFNSNRNIKRLRVVGDGGYEPTEVAKGALLETVTVAFKRGIQGVVKSSCC